MNQQLISTGIDGLDRSIDCLRYGETVIWQIDQIGDYMFAATKLITKAARGGQRLVYIRFGDHDEIMDAEALASAGYNVKKYCLDPYVGFETFAFQVHRIISLEGKNVFFVFDCLSDLQNYWFSDLMISNFFLLINPFLQEQEAVAYQAIKYSHHTYETVSRIRRATPLLINTRSLDGSIYIQPVKVEGRHTRTMYFPLKITGYRCETITSSADNYAIFEKFTQTGERRDCWDSMFDSIPHDGSEPKSAEGKRIKENIMQCLLGTEPTRLDLCRKYFSTKDLMDIKNREIGTGCIGGKAVGMLLARNIIRDEAPDIYARMEPHDSYFIGADVFYTYAVQNGVWTQRTKLISDEDYFECAPNIREKLLTGKFMPNIKEQFLSMLEYFGQSPIIVRSSSLLEDGFGNAFAGKYESVFCPNQGSLEERYKVFEAAVRTVYASTESYDAIKYRADRKLLDRDEQMALLVMRVCGDCHGSYYYPHIAGVGHSKNLYITKANAKLDNKGMLRLVFGMGTRAVDREADDYAKLLNMDDPAAPAMVNYGDEYKFSQHKMDLIDLEKNSFTTVYADTIDKRELKTDPYLFMEPDYATAARFRDMGLYGESVPDIINFQKLIKKTSFTDTMTDIMALLSRIYNYPVDIEFACNFDRAANYRINLLQCRPLQTRGIGKAGVMPKVKDFFFRINGNFMGGNLALPIKYCVFVKVEPYLSLTRQEKYQVARTIGKLNLKLTGENTVLMGPGRWGTTEPSLGVPVNFMEISHFDCMCELAYNSHGLRPELSYGSHFFQDLVEADTFYAAVYQGEEGCEFNEAMFDKFPNRYAELMDASADDPMCEVIKVYDFSADEVILFSEIENQDCFLATM